MNTLENGMDFKKRELTMEGEIYLGARFLAETALLQGFASA